MTTREVALLLRALGDVPIPAPSLLRTLLHALRAEAVEARRSGANIAAQGRPATPAAATLLPRTSPAPATAGAGAPSPDSILLEV